MAAKEGLRYETRLNDKRLRLWIWLSHTQPGILYQQADATDASKVKMKTGSSCCKCKALFYLADTTAKTMQ